MAVMPEHIRAQLIAARIDTILRYLDKVRAAETDPAITTKLDTLRAEVADLIKLFEDRIPATPPQPLPSTGNQMPNTYEGAGLSGRHVKRD